MRFKTHDGSDGQVELDDDRRTSEHRPDPFVVARTQKSVERRWDLTRQRRSRSIKVDAALFARQNAVGKIIVIINGFRRVVVVEIDAVVRHIDVVDVVVVEFIVVMDFRRVVVDQLN